MPNSINSVQVAVDSLRAAFDKHVAEDRIVYERTETMQQEVTNIHAQLQAQAEQAVILKQVQDTVNGYEMRIRNFLAFLKWLATIIGMILASVISALIISHH